VNELTLPIRNLLGRATRTALTTAGIAVAIGGFVALTGLTGGVQHSLSSGIEESGADLVVSQRSAFSLIASTVPESLGPKIAAVDGVEAVSGVLLTITTAEEAANILLAAWPMPSFLWGGVRLIEGRLPDETDQWGVVLGEAIARGLHKQVGDTIELQFQPYRVVGVAAFASTFNENVALVPLKGMQELLSREGLVTLFQVRLARPLDPARIATVKSRLATAAQGYDVGDTQELASNVRLFNVIRAIASTVSLVVLAMAALGIANTLLMAVSERTAEIGILSAIGWSPARILRLIIVEGLVMNLVGGVIGLGLGIVAMYAVSNMEVAAGLIEPYLSGAVILEALAAVLIIGPMAALYPAWRATRLVPADALRTA
jgi:putative ABC transport system permease protein